MLLLARSHRWRALATCAAGGSRRAASSSLAGGAAPLSSSNRSANSSSAGARAYKNPFLSASHAASSFDDDDEQPATPLLTLTAPPYALFPGDVHCVLGLNGSGKSRFLAQLQAASDHQQQQQRSQQRCRVASLSLDAHRAFVALHGEKVVAHVLGGVGSPSARDLIVRLGLYPVWESRVAHLSTGEMRKLMLAETLLQTPRANVLMLDQPFDGLDAAARKQLEWMLGQLTRGFTRLLVDTGGRNDALAYRTQVLLVANRLEQVFPEILTHAVLLRSSKESSETSRSSSSASSSISPSTEIVACGDLQDDEAGRVALLDRLRAFFDEEQRKRPAMCHEEMVALVQELFDCQTPVPGARPMTRAVELQQVSIAYDRRVLLDAVNFSRERHEHWVLLGPNGSGKSSLMRVLMQTPGHGLTSGDVFIGTTKIGVSHDSQGQQQARVGAVSTDQHIRLLHHSVLEDEEGRSPDSQREPVTSAFDVIAENARSVEKARVAAKLLRLPEATLRSRSLAELSQGEQKLVLIARTLAACPQVLILDEITHGLDPFNRAHVLQVVNAIGKHAATSTHLILITHHEDEITDCFTGVFEIRDKQLVERASDEQ